MRTVRENENWRRLGRWGICAGLTGFACFLSLAAGCSKHKSQLTGDPLFEDCGLKNPWPNPNPSTPAGRTQGAAPPVPTSQFSPTNAALAGVQPLPGARPLAINPGARPTSGTALPTAGAPAGVLQPVIQPVPRDTPAASVIPVGGPAVWTPPPAPNSTTALFKQLDDLGVRWNKLENVPEGVRFSAIVPSRTDPTTSRVYEAIARDQASAIQAVLRQIESQR